MTSVLAFRVWAAALALVFGVAFFGVLALVLAWFQSREGVAGPVTDLGYGALVGIVLTGGLLAQLWSPERAVAGLQQALLVIPALVAGSALAWDPQNLVPALILVPALGVLVALHPARSELVRPGRVSRALLIVAVATGVPLVAYALAVGEQARGLSGPPHHVQRLSTMAALAIAIGLVALLASLRTPGWRIAAACAGAATVVLGLAFVVRADDPGAAGRWWGVLAIAGGSLWVLLASTDRQDSRRCASASSRGSS